MIETQRHSSGSRFRRTRHALKKLSILASFCQSHNLLQLHRFGAWLRQQYYERTWDAPSPAALNAALNVLEAQAQFDGLQPSMMRSAKPGPSLV
jgi:hypothetical protein